MRPKGATRHFSGRPSTIIKRPCQYWLANGAGCGPICLRTVRKYNTHDWKLNESVRVHGAERMMGLECTELFLAISLLIGKAFAENLHCV